MILQHIKKQLEALGGLVVSERGSGVGKFLFVRSPNRAIEVYEEPSGIFIECWESADEEADDASVKKEIVKSESEALEKIKNWFYIKT
jgi:hypothetical protein